MPGRQGVGQHIAQVNGQRPGHAIRVTELVVQGAMVGVLGAREQPCQPSGRGHRLGRLGCPCRRGASGRPTMPVILRMLVRVVVRVRVVVDGDVHIVMPLTHAGQAGLVRRCGLPRRVHHAVNQAEGLAQDQRAHQDNRPDTTRVQPGVAPGPTGHQPTPVRQRGGGGADSGVGRGTGRGVDDRVDRAQAPNCA